MRSSKVLASMGSWAGNGKPEVVPPGWRIAPDKRACGHRRTDSRMVGHSVSEVISPGMTSQKNKSNGGSDSRFGPPFLSLSRLHARFLEVGTGVPLLHPCDLESLWRMTRAQRAMACAVGIVPVSVAGVVLVRCDCSLAAYVIEIATAVGYLVFILAAPR